MPSKLLSAALAVTIGLLFVPPAHAETESYSYHRTEHVTGVSTGPLCFEPVPDIPAISVPELCQETIVTWEWNYFAEIACGSDEFVYSDTITVKGLVSGEGTLGIGAWYVGPSTYVGGYGVDAPFVYTGSQVATTGVALSGENLVSGQMHFSGDGPGTVTAETVQEKCPESAPIGGILNGILDCVTPPLTYGRILACLASTNS